MFFIPLLASASILNLQCLGSDDRTFDFTLDLDTHSGEMVYTVKDKSYLYLSDRLIVTPNYIKFPFEDTGVIIDRNTNEFSFGISQGRCN